MSEGQKKRKKPEKADGPSDDSPSPDGSLDEVSQKAKNLFAAADDAIGKAISGNSEDFLRKNRQSGGQ